MASGHRGTLSTISGHRFRPLRRLLADEDGANHSATSNRGVFDTGIIARGEGGETIYGSGAYGDHCVVHPGMEGTFQIRPG
jgi:hypothetical protein